MVPRGLKGSKLDENFAELRDVCSYFYNGHDRTKPQLGAFIISLPFTFIYHMNAFSTTLAYYCCGIPTNGSRFPSPIPLSIHLSNIMVMCAWFLGGKVGLILTTATKLFNQNFYDSLLFKRSLKDFLLSFVFGNVLAIQENNQNRRNLVVRVRDEDAASSRQTPADVDIEEGRKFANSKEFGQRQNENAVEGEIDLSRRNETDILSLPSSANSLVESGSFGPGRVRIYIEENRDLCGSDGQGQQSHPLIEDSISAHKLQHLATINAVSTEKEETIRQQRTFSKPARKNVVFDMSKKMIGRYASENKRQIEWSDEFLNPSDIHLDMENHPGTVAFRNVINDAISKFPTKTYTFRKHNWVMRKLHGRYFFDKENGDRRRKLGRAEAKNRCKFLHDKQALLRSEIAGILTELKDLKRNHTNSKSNSDHSRNSKTIPVEMSKALSCIIKNDSSHDQIPKHPRAKDVNARHNLESASTAKDSHVDSHVESSKESTISTLTQSNGTFPPNGARSTPWIRGPAKELKELNEITPTGESTHLRDAISGLLEYTSWLENLNPLRDSKMDTPEKTNFKESKHREGDQLLAKRQRSGIVTEVTAGANTGGVEKVKDAYWHSLVDETTKTTKFTAKFQSKGKQGEAERNPEHSEHPPNTIQWNKSTRKNVDAENISSKDSVRLFPLWRRALQKIKNMEVLRNENPACNGSEVKGGPSFWRKKKNMDAYIDLHNDTKAPTRNTRLDPSADIDDIISPEDDERRDDGYREPRSPRKYRKLSSPRFNVVEERQDHFDQFLDRMDEDVLRQWEGESSSINQTTTHVSSKNHATIPSVKQPSKASIAYCGGNGCDAFGACALPITSTDADDDIYVHE
jgi:hypothetical protein